SLYYFVIVFVIIMYKTKATAGRALAFIVRIFVNDTIAIAVWTSFHAIGVWRSFQGSMLMKRRRPRSSCRVQVGPSACSRLESARPSKAVESDGRSTWPRVTKETARKP